MIGTATTFTPAQREVLNTMSCLHTEEDLMALKQVLVKFLNSRLQAQIDKLWDDGTITESTIEQWSQEHLRTPYKE